MPLLREDGRTRANDYFIGVYVLGTMISNQKYKIKKMLFRHLKKEHAFWSYDPQTVTFARMGDDFLIEKVLYHLDWDDIMKLFEIYPKTQVKEVWKNHLCPLGDYFGRMNVLFATVLFDIKNPERYIRVQRNRYVKNRIDAHKRLDSQDRANI
jgi:hypothetical protein